MVKISTLFFAFETIFFNERILEYASAKTNLMTVVPLQASASSRLLNLKCPLKQSIYAEDESYALDKNRYSKGNTGRNMIQKLRGSKSASFYQKLVDNIIMSLCDVENEEERCVPIYSSLAAKDWNNTCIVAADNICPKGFCERIPSCYWGKLVERQNRSTRYPVENYAKARKYLISYKDNDSYIRETAKLCIIGTVIAAVLLILWLFYFVARYCCCCLWTSFSACYLCSPIPNKEGYDGCTQWVVPSFIYVLTFTGIIASGILAFVGNEDINVATTNSFENVSILLGDIAIFLNGVKGHLTSVQDIIIDAAVDAKVILNGTDYIKTTAVSISSAFAAFSSLHSQGLNMSNSLPGFDSALSAFNNEFSPVVDDIQGMIDTLEDDLYKNNENIQSSLNSATDQIQNLENQTELWQDKVHHYESKEYNFRTIRKLSVLGVFLVSFTIALVGSIGILCSRKGQCCRLHGLLDFTGIFSAILGSIALILASLAFFVAFLWNDACVISSIAINDLEPFFGERIASSANALLNDASLSEAFNITDMLDFHNKLDGNAMNIENVNISEELEKVNRPLENIQGMVDSISTTAIKGFNEVTTVNISMCPFNDIYAEETIFQPWEANTGKNATPWILNETGYAGNYARYNLENRADYIARIYDVAGVCKESNSCCLNGICNQSIAQRCNTGNNCEFVCSEVTNLINIGYEASIDAVETELKLTADLGVKCPAQINGYQVPSCPTTEFREEGHNRTLLALIQAYGENITTTSDDLLNISETSIGNAMQKVKLLLCDMDTSLFVGTRYDDIEDNICGTMFGGFAQVCFALLFAAMSLEFLAIFAILLSTRARGLSKEDASKDDDSIYYAP